MRLIVLLLLSFITFSSWAQLDTTQVKNKKWYVPTYGKMQFAGGTGLLSLEAGYELSKENIRLGGYYGLLPSIKGRNAIQNFGVDFTWLIHDFYLKENEFQLIPTFGFRINKVFGDGNRTFTSLPSSFPEGYYPPTSFSIFPQFGAEFQWNNPSILKVRSISFYVSAVTNDIYISHVIPNKYHGLGDLFSASLGTVIRF